MPVISYIDAISKGLWEEMERDSSVFLLGEDIGECAGGAFKVTKGFLNHFGSDRVVDTVLAESAILGAATGAALVGMKPVAEMQFADFVTCGFNQLVNIPPPYIIGGIFPCRWSSVFRPVQAYTADRFIRAILRRGFFINRD